VFAERAVDSSAESVVGDSSRRAGTEADDGPATRSPENNGIFWNFTTIVSYKSAVSDTGKSATPLAHRGETEGSDTTDWK
jgi:hypothetical protein